MCVLAGGVILNNSTVLPKFCGEARQKEDNMRCVCAVCVVCGVCVCVRGGPAEKVRHVGGFKWDFFSFSFEKRCSGDTTLKMGQGNG